MTSLDNSFDAQVNLDLCRLLDLICGLTVGVMAVPQGTVWHQMQFHSLIHVSGIAYALLANLPPILGLYTSFVPPLLYTFLGLSPQVSMGMLTGASCAAFTEV